MTCASAATFRTVLCNHLAPQKIQTLDAVWCPRGSRVELVVPVVLFDVVFAGIPVTAVHLDREAVGLQAPL